MTSSGEIVVELAGGVGEMGHHHLLLDLGGDSFAVDCGARFPGPADPGIELIGPPLDAAIERARAGRLRALILTHGHLDHIGCVGALLEAVPDLPVLGTPWTLGRLGRLLARERKPPPPTARQVEPGEAVLLGEARVTWHTMTHSIPGACSVAFESPSGTVIHSGDFRVQPDPLLGPPSDVEGLTALGQRGVDLALVDSTGAGRPGRTPPERAIVEALVEAAADCSGRIVVTLFSSHVERVQACVLAAEALGRRIAVYGSSLVDTTADARTAGLLTAPPGQLVPIDDVLGLPRHKQFVVVTGTQGEQRAPLARIARGQDSRLRISPGDRVLWSARVIPGNARAVNGVVAGLVKQGADVRPPWQAPQLHASGHGHADEIAEWLDWVSPRFVMPVHGEEIHLLDQRRGLAAAGRAADTVPQARSGERLRLRPETGDWSVEAGVGGSTWAVVGRTRWEMGDPALAERRRAAREGVAVATVEREGSSAGRLVSLVTLGVFDEPRRAAGEAAVVAQLAAGLPMPWDEEELRLWLRRAVRQATGLRPQCRVEGALVRMVESDQG